MLYVFRFDLISSLMSLLCAFVGIWLSMTSLNLVGLWVGIEINFLSAVCFMSGKSLGESEMVMKYFVMQVMGSCFMMVGVLMLVNWVFLSFSNYLLMFGLLVKLGCFPFHFWIPSVMSDLSWSGCFMMSVIQKFIPLWFLSNIQLNGAELMVLEILACCTCLVGCLGGLSMLSYRVLLGYSSLVHLGVMILLCCVNVSAFMIYFFLYAVLNFFLMSSMSLLNIYSFSDLLKEKSLMSLMESWWVSLYFLSLAGLPPFTGSVMKLYFLLTCWNLMPIGCVVCVLSSVVSLYFYLGVLFSVMVFWGSSLSFYSLESSNYLGVLIKAVSLFMNLVIGYGIFLYLGVS